MKNSTHLHKDLQSPAIVLIMIPRPILMVMITRILRLTYYEMWRAIPTKQPRRTMKMKMMNQTRLGYFQKPDSALQSKRVLGTWGFQAAALAPCFIDIQRARRLPPGPVASASHAEFTKTHSKNRRNIIG